MIIISMPRCGGTKYCQDLSNTTGLPYKGDMDIYNLPELGSVWHHIKTTHHETNTGGFITIDDTVDTVSNYKDNIVLINKNFTPMLPFGDVYLIRKNLRNIFTSLTEYWLRIGGGEFPTIFNEKNLKEMAVQCKIYIEYLNNNNIEPVYYEDYFNDHPHNTPILDNHKAKEAYLHFIDETMSQLGLSALSSTG